MFFQVYKVSTLLKPLSNLSGVLWWLLGQVTKNVSTQEWRQESFTVTLCDKIVAAG